VLLEEAFPDDIPFPLTGFPHYLVGTEPDYDKLYPRLTSATLTGRNSLPFRFKFKIVGTSSAYFIPCMHSFGSMTPRLLTILKLPLLAWAMYMFIRT
jgi:hypothetical protein